jgi:hypothetical protein
MFTEITRVVGVFAAMWAALSLTMLWQDRGTRAARWFTAAGWLIAACGWAVLCLTPYEDIPAAVARAGTVWAAVGTGLIVRRHLLARNGL